MTRSTVTVRRLLYALAAILIGASPLPTAAAARAVDVGAPSGPPATATGDDVPVGSETPDSGGGHPSSHEDSAGLKLVAAPDDASPGTTCARDAAVREERIAALAVDITLNRYLDHDPQGRMFAFEDDVTRVRAEERRNTAARAGDGEPADTAGLQGDAIQPLVLRVHPGECLRIVLHNELPNSEAASVVAHGAGLQVVGAGPATVTNPQSFAAPDATVTYEWQIPADEPEGTHYLHSAGDERAQVNHGLFGALIVEPPGSTWLDPRTGSEAHGGWDAVITRPDAPAFREFTLIYHEVGDESYQVTNRAGEFVPLVDPLTEAYRPGSRALNYRSEPFSNRLALGQQTTGRVDESLAYSSYSYGDPATPLLRTYLGEPVKQRVLHGGSEVFHVHHVHGGSIRWARQPGEDPELFGDGLDKTPPLVPGASERTDAQTIGPSESFDVADECAAGGCQQSAGDFLYHCHIAHHYFAGMWGIWRVYNTLQDGPASTDMLPPFVPLPDEAGTVAAAVPASRLAGTTVDSHGLTTKLDVSNLTAWVDEQLPPPGTPKGYDASVWNWRREGADVFGEPDDTAAWPGYRSATPGAAPQILFDPRTGRPAYPFMRPHLAARPPFAPNHGPAPYLDPVPSGADPPTPGASGPASTCPEGTRLRHFDVNAIRQSVPLNQQQNLVDPHGQLYVLRQQEDAARADPKLQVPLAIRANAGEDCVDVLLRNEIDDGPDRAFSKVSLHIHFVQFDAQASDGLDAGFNYEQSVRPFRAEAVAISAPSDVGATDLTVSDTTRFSLGAVIGVGIDQDATFETRRIADIRGSTLVFDRSLAHPHGSGELVSAEFVRYRWYPDAQFGTSYFHDHVDAIHAWAHGLFGALIAEPPGSTYTDPHSGAELLSGPVADIHTNAQVSADVTGSFRELSLFVQDDVKINEVGRSTGSAYGLRAEPLDGRPGPTDQLFSSHEHGDPATLTLEANLGDPIVVRSLVGATNDIHTVHVDGHWFRSEPWSDASPPVDTIRVGISERYDVVIPAAGGAQHMPGDYLYYSGRPSKLHEGSWGLVRVYAKGDGALAPLPGHEDVPPAADAVCPAGAPIRPFAVSAVDVPLPMLDGQPGKIYVLDAQRDAVASGAVPPTPLVLHANVGDCLEITVTNATRDGPVTYHCDLLAAAPTDGGGVAAGNDPSQSVAPGGKRTFTYYAAPEIGETTATVRDFGDVVHNPALGLYGAVVIGPSGTTYRGDGWAVDAFPPHASPYRDATLLLQDDDDSLGTHRMPYTTAPRGVSAVNYETAPTTERVHGEQDAAQAFVTGGQRDPPTPIIDAFAGDPLRIHLLAPYSEQVQMFGLEGHEWPVDHANGSRLVGSTAIGGLETLTVEPIGGAGGRDAVPGDYRYGNERAAYRDAGQWGIVRVHPRSSHIDGLESLDASSSSRLPTWLTIGAVGVVIGALTLLFVRRRA